jgi:outer membrane immunogenic protein
VAPDFIRWDCWQFGILAGYTNLDLPGGNTANGPVFGGFLGYNFQWDQLVIGFDIGYKYASVLDFSTATTHFKLVDYVPGGARAGYAIGTFLPYALVGVAVGRFNYGDFVAGTGKTNAFQCRVSHRPWRGLGDHTRRLCPCRVEYVAFAAVGGTISQINTGQLGVGVRF